LPIIAGKDCIEQAQSGTGKTATYVIGILQKIKLDQPYCQALILSPTRELAQQITDVVRDIGEYLKVRVHACVGGTNLKDDIAKLKSSGAQVVVATPGRITDLLKKEIMSLKFLQVFVMDEADEMLSRGFKSQIQEIFKFIPSDTQVCLFSATMPKDILEMSNTFMKSPAKILVKKEKLTLEGIRQYYVAVKDEWRYDVLVDLYKSIEISQAIIYCNARKRVEELSTKMKDDGFTVSAIHGEMKQEDRNKIMKEFRTAASRVLISTDLLARGIDVQAVGLVINYEMPMSKENYLHRIGRSGRYGRKGVAINFVSPREADTLKEIKEYYQTQVNELPQDVTGIIS
jgi:translation initiation factor 4A